MKIRQGFVSNSSSSNFIVGFYKNAVPKTADEVKRMLFKDREIIQPYDDTITSDMAAEDIIKQIEEQKPMDVNQIANEIDCEYLGGPKYKDYMLDVDTDPKDNKHKEAERKRLYDVAYEVYRIESAKFSVDWAEQMMEKHSDKIFFLFSYSDNEGPFGSCMEHGDVFADAPFNLRISHH